MIECCLENEGSKIQMNNKDVFELSHTSAIFCRLSFCSMTEFKLNRCCHKFYFIILLFPLVKAANVLFKSILLCWVVLWLLKNVNGTQIPKPGSLARAL